MIIKGTVSDVIVAIMKKYDVQTVAGHTAHGAVKSSGRIACCFATVGPGASNLFPGGAAAFNDNIPILVLTGNNQLRDLNPGRDLLQELDHVAVFRNVTKFSETVVQPGRVVPTKNPVHVDFLDFFDRWQAALPV